MKEVIQFFEMKTDPEELESSSAQPRLKNHQPYQENQVYYSFFKVQRANGLLCLTAQISTRTRYAIRFFLFYHKHYSDDGLCLLSQGTNRTKNMSAILEVAGQKIGLTNSEITRKYQKGTEEFEAQEQT